MDKVDHPGYLDPNESSINNVHLISAYQMNDLMEKLKLLNYEQTILKELKMRPLNKHYFNRSTNPGEQFFVFVSLCAWLIRKTGRDFEQPQEFHDPSLTIANIMKVLQDMGISIDFSTNKLMQGAGLVCTYVLDSLVTQAIKVNKSQLPIPKIITEDDDINTDVIDNENEIILEKVEEEQNAIIGSDDSDEEKTNILMDVKQRNSEHQNFKMASMNDTENWRLQFERVMPSLKVVVKADPRDWRAHWEQVVVLKENINSVFEDTRSNLRKLQNVVTFTMEKIENREKHLNNELHNLIEQYKNVSMEFAQLEKLLKGINEEKMTTEQTLEHIANEYESVKLQMEQRGNTMSDGSPLLNIKKAIIRIKEEILEMDLEIGVTKHTFDQDCIKQNSMYDDIDQPIASNY